MSRGREPRGGRPPPVGANAGYPLGGIRRPRADLDHALWSNTGSAAMNEMTFKADLTDWADSVRRANSPAAHVAD